MSATEPTESEIKLQSALVKERAVSKESKALLQQAREKLAEATRQIQEAGVIANPQGELVAQHIDDMVKAKLATTTHEQLAKIATLETELAESRAATEASRTAFAAKTIEQTLREACAKHFIIPKAVDDVVKLGSLELHVAEDGSIKTATDGTVEDYIDSLKHSSPYLWPPSRGAGARGGDLMKGELGSAAFTPESNPFDPKSSAHNLTAQGTIFKTDPALAARLKAAAGV
jgi:hypothetical protein